MTFFAFFCILDREVTGMSDVAKHIRKYRTQRGLTQDALAERLHVTRQAVSNWETGKNQPDLDMLEAIAAALTVEVAALFGGEGSARAAYPRYQRKAVIWVAVLGFVTLLLLLDRLFLAPYLLKLRAQTFNIWPDLLNAIVAAPVCRVAAGMLIPAAVSLWRSVKPEGRLRIILRLAPVVLLLPVLLTWLGFIWPTVYPVTFFVLTDPTRFRLSLVMYAFPYLAGLSLYPAWC